MIGPNGLPGPAGFQGPRGERGTFTVYAILNKYTTITKIVLGGTAPGLWGGVGLPGAPGRAGGKDYLFFFERFFLLLCLFFFLI